MKTNEFSSFVTKPPMNFFGGHFKNVLQVFGTNSPSKYGVSH